jgi:acyl-CoA thioester hydrolase
MTDPAPFRFGFRVRYSEVDYQGIVYFAHHATYFDVAIHEFFRALPYDYTAVRSATGTDFNIVRSVVEYRRPLRFDEAFEVEVALGRIGRTSLTFAPAIRVAGEAEPRATGEVVWVHADQATMRAVPLPQPLLELLKARSDGSPGELVASPPSR